MCVTQTLRVRFLFWTMFVALVRKFVAVCHLLGSSCFCSVMIGLVFGYEKSQPNLRSTGFLVGVPGLEPGKAGPESAVLPLHHTPNFGCNRDTLSNTGAKVRLFCKSTKFLSAFFQKKLLLGV